VSEPIIKRAEFAMMRIRFANQHGKGESALLRVIFIGSYFAGLQVK
jgi:hypothetical protein